MFRRLLDRLSGALPGQCEVCHAWPARPVCDSCATRFAQPRARCLTCALPVPAGLRQCGACLKAPPPLDRCLAAVDYAYPWSNLIGRFKFNNTPGWAASLAELLRSTPWVEPALDETDLLLPMPLSRERLQQRGYNQALVLARQLAPAKTRPDLLLRLRDTPAQSALARAERMRNVRGAFAVEPLRLAEVRDRRIVLLDDVMTSGASLYAAARALRDAGAAHITGLVLARTE